MGQLRIGAETHIHLAIKSGLSARRTLQPAPQMPGGQWVPNAPDAASSLRHWGHWNMLTRSLVLKSKWAQSACNGLPSYCFQGHSSPDRDLSQLSTGRVLSKNENSKKKKVRKEKNSHNTKCQRWEKNPGIRPQRKKYNETKGQTWNFIRLVSSNASEQLFLIEITD